VIHGCTVIARNYAADARLLSESFLRHNPGATFSVLVADDPRGELSFGEAVDTFAPADVGIDADELNRRATMYGAAALVSSLKPNLLMALLGSGRGPAVLLDADGCVYGDLGPIATLAERHALLLSPHTLDPFPLGDDIGPEQVILRAGVMNGGFVGVGEGAEPFLEWWAQRTARHCLDEPNRALSLSQTWLTLAPALFDHHILRDHGCNAMGCNLGAHDVVWDGDVPTIDGARLRHFHFTGRFDPDQPHRLTTKEDLSAWFPSLEQRPGVARLCRAYARDLIEHGYHAARATQYPYDSMPAGTSLEPWMRTVYRQALMQSERDQAAEPPNPFSAGDERFLRWIESAVVEQEATRFPELYEPESGHELARALTERKQLLSRVAELEAQRDDATQWAQLADRDVAYARSAIAERDGLIDDLRGALDEYRAELERIQALLVRIWRSPSWRMTAPLRFAKSLAQRDKR
jgi:hypothetical protein